MNNNNQIACSQDPAPRWTIHQGDVQLVAPTLKSDLFDAVLTDPPYGLGFMGLGWDSTVPPTSIWKSLLQLCKPGAFLLAFGGSKTSHRLACNIEDAGWEIRDSICWIYGQGFPKGVNLSKAIDKELGINRPILGEQRRHRRRSGDNYRFGFGNSSDSIPLSASASDLARSWEGYHTALKPAWEPIIIAQRPREGTFARNAIDSGCGGLNIDGSRIGTKGGTQRSHQEPYPRVENGREDRQSWARTGHTTDQIAKGRWPANVIRDDESAEELDCQSGQSRSRVGMRHQKSSGVGNGKTLHPFKSRVEKAEGYHDEGGASRFFYKAKAGRKERRENNHPTVKPLELCKYLARLVLPPERHTPRQLLVPFSGSGSEMLGALQSGWDHVTGIEREPRYVEIAKRRLMDLGNAATTPS